MEGRGTAKMIVQKPSDILAYLSETGPIPLEDLVTRSGAEAGEVVHDLTQLVQSGEVEVVGAEKEELQRVLRELDEKVRTSREVVAVAGAEDGAVAFAGGPDADEMQRALYDTLRQNNAGRTKLQLSFRGFRNLQNVPRR
jgi:malonyl CoA-acyl carrier protein transacylase